MMKKLVSLLLCTALVCIPLLCSCTVTGTSCAVYRVSEDETMLATGELMSAETVLVTSGQTRLETVLAALEAESLLPVTYNPVKDIEILSCTVTEGVATLELGLGYLKLEGLGRTLADACYTLTLCSLSDIDKVSISVNGEVLASDLSSSDMLTDNTGSGSFRREICLYFTNEAHTALTPEYRSLSVSASAQAERHIIEELISPAGSLHSPLPDGTELLGVTRKGRTCILNLSSEFLTNRPQTATGEYIAVYSLVNSLCSLGGITEVLLTVEGDTIGKYVNLDLSGTITAAGFTSSQPLGLENALSTKVYYKSDSRLFGVPCIVDGGEDEKQQLLDLLMEVGDFGCYDSLFTQADELRHVRTGYGVCTIVVSRSFFERRTPNEAILTLDALLLTLMELPDVSSVSLSYPDGTKPQIPSRDLSAPVMKVTSEIIE